MKPCDAPDVRREHSGEATGLSVFGFDSGHSRWENGDKMREEQRVRECIMCRRRGRALA